MNHKGDEAKIEKAFVKAVEAHGGEAIKLRVDGQVGFPDRTVVLPNGRIFFIEFKSPGGVLSRAQIQWKWFLSQLGFDVYVTDNIDEAMRILSAYVEERENAEAKQSIDGRHQGRIEKKGLSALVGIQVDDERKQGTVLFPSGQR